MTRLPAPPVPPVPEISLRLITSADAAVVAALHADSWRSAYRGILSDAYLDGPMDAERAADWRGRLAAADDGRFGLIASADERPVGFVFLARDVDVEHGSLIDNLHVATAARSAGLGPRLLSAAAAEVVARGWNRRVHLWVYAANRRARDFYARMGGREVEHTTKVTPDGATAPTVRVAWADVAALQS